MEKGVGDKGEVGRRDVRQNAPVGLSREHPGSFSIIFFFSLLFSYLAFSLSSPYALWISSKRESSTPSVFPSTTFLSCLSAKTSEMLLLGSRKSADSKRHRRPPWMATLTNQSYSRFHPSSLPEETPTGVSLRATLSTSLLLPDLPLFVFPLPRLHPSKR